MNDSSKTYTVLELLCVFFWFLLDGFWLMEWKILTFSFSVLALMAALAMFFFIKHEKVLILVACADSSWLVCNILWSIGDLSHVEKAILYARIVFFIGLLLCAVAFFSADATRKLSSLVLSRLRIMKFFETK